MSDMGKHSDPLLSVPRGRSAPSLLLSMGAAILVTAVIFGSAGFADRDGNRAHSTTKASAARPTPAAAAGAGGSTSVASRPTFELRWTHGQSWVRVTDHKGTVVLNDIYPQGTVKRFTGPSFTLEIGNAGSVSVIDKGGALRRVGTTSQTVKLTITGP